MNKPMIGGVISIWTHLSGIDTPPKGEYIQLTAGLSGSGGYNEGLITNESVTGSFPLITATATIIDGPMSGSVVHLSNTERSFFRAGQSGLLEDDMIQDHNHSLSFSVLGRSSDPKAPGVYRVRARSTGTFSVNNVSGARTGTETRPKNIGATYFMRIK